VTGLSHALNKFGAAIVCIHSANLRPVKWAWLAQAGIALVPLAIAPLNPRIIATALLLLLLFLCFIAQTAVLVTNCRL
jgi:hypothetical protein